MILWKGDFENDEERVYGAAQEISEAASERDYENAIEYFSEYFDEAGPENEQQVMEELGEPKEAARELLLNLLQESVGDGKDSTGEKRRNARQKVPATDGVQQDKCSCFNQ